MGKYDLLVANFVDNFDVPVGSGIIIALDDKEALLITACHVIKKQNEILWENYKIYREIDGERILFEFDLKSSFLDETMDLAIARIKCNTEIRSIKFLSPTENRNVELVGYPGVLQNSPSITKYCLTSKIRDVLPKISILEIQQYIETYENGRKENLNGFSGGGVFFESQEKQLFF